MLQCHVSSMLGNNIEDIGDFCNQYISRGYKLDHFGTNILAQTYDMFTFSLVQI